MVRFRPILPSCRRAPLAPAAVLLGAVLAIASPLRAEPLSASYQVYFGGFHVLNAEAQWQRGAGDYRITAEAETRGFVGWLNPWKGTTASRGFVDGARVIPASHESWGEGGDGEKIVTLTYDPDGDLAEARVLPEQDWDGRHPLPPDAGKGTLDPMSVIAGLSELLQAGGHCEGSFAVFDGRKRYDLFVSDAGEKVLEPTSYSIYAGPARGCRLDYEMLGGHRIERNKYAETARERVVWVARPAEGAPLVPVRLEIETAYGTVMGHLTGFAQGPQVEAKLPDSKPAQ
ncbi:MAG: DUF3108 domain-containing protein [Kiloniellaceae bacterium]